MAYLYGKMAMLNELNVTYKDIIGSGLFNMNQKDNTTTSFKSQGWNFGFPTFDVWPITMIPDSHREKLSVFEDFELD